MKQNQTECIELLQKILKLSPEDQQYAIRMIELALSKKQAEK